ncbi:MAG: M1 family metallopeptidase [Flavobacteriales bacterium]|nr:M1 family metallopeptidase [Flavobacteriales bacterium]
MNKILLWCLLPLLVFAQEADKKERQPGKYDNNKFSQNYQLYATPNMFRTASGAPGPAYYQQQADYVMEITLDDKNKKLYGVQTVTYYNNSPETLEYLWVQLDQNEKKRTSDNKLINSERVSPGYTPTTLTKSFLQPSFDGGYNIEYVKDSKGNNQSHTINNTMMRINLATPLKPKEKFTFSIKWWYNINNYQVDRGRSGYEELEDGNRIYVIAQFFPRMAVYNDVEGWQNMQFWGSGEFALTFGNYDVKITVPSDHVMEATGDLQNRKDVFTAEQVKRYELAQKTFDKPVLVVTPEEAKKAEKGFATTTKTWHFKAQNVRDFAFSTSRKFILDAMAVKLETTTPMAISLYPNEANPLWGEYSTKAVAQTLKTYSKHTFDYPYPKAVSVSAEDQGMEYPMICWNYGRPDKNGYVSDRIKYGMISVIIHEVGHNYFPMIVNSDERQWTWMDEGLNTFLEYLTEQEFEENYPSQRGPAAKIVPYMSGNQDFLEPIMSNSEVIHQFGPNAYGKPATALNILRETVMGKELFDYAFKIYANRWKFKHPTPEDFFRTMEDASAIDLDWFWRGWFYSTDYVDMGIKEVKQYYVSLDPTKEQEQFAQRRGRFGIQPGPYLYMIPDGHAELKDKYKKGFQVKDFETLEKFIEKNFTAEERAEFKNPQFFYEVTFDKPGGLIMPIIVELEFEDGTKELHKFREQIWRKNNQTATRVFATDKKVKKIQLDPKLETADIDVSNNVWPKEEVKSKFDNK